MLSGDCQAWRSRRRSVNRACCALCAMGFGGCCGSAVHQSSSRRCKPAPNKIDWCPMKISVRHPALAGHFPGNPVVPGVVILDEVLGAVSEFAGRSVRTTGLPNVKFSAPLSPGEEFEIVFESKGNGRAAFSVRNGARIFAAGVLVYEFLHSG